MSVVIEKLHSYKIPELGINFVNRVFEIEQVFKQILNMEISWIHVIYGPWGCGKSEFFKALTYAIYGFENIIAMYIDLTENEFTKAIQVPEINLRKFIQEVIGNLGSTFSIIIKLYSFIKSIFDKFQLKGRKILIIIDEITKSLDYYRLSIRDFVSSLDKKIHEIVEEFKLDKIFPILITSDLTAIEKFNKEQGKSLSVLMMWHLPKNDYFKLLDKLKCPIDLYEILWKLTGGCPRITIDLKLKYLWNIEYWLSNVINNVREVIETYCRFFEKSIVDVIKKELTPNPDEIAFKPISKIFLENNILIRLKPKHARLSTIENDSWVGEYYAWQIPTYMYVVKAISDKDSLDITYKDVIEQI